MHRHAFSNLKARVEDGGVHLGFYTTTPIFKAREEAKPADPILIRIHRLSLPDFRWGQDYGEHFDGLEIADAELIFEGPIDPINDRKFETLDATVEIGQTYAYWVSSPLARFPTGPVAVRIRDPRIWWPHHEVESRMRAMAAAHPDLVKVDRYGTTAGDRAIRGLEAGNRENCIALVGLIHAGESGPELMLPAVERLLQEHPDLLTRTGVAILPSVNADERERQNRGCPWYLRRNARDVDINRNFDVDWEEVEYGYGLVSSDPDADTYRGPGPESEPETRAVVSFLNATRPKAVYSFHALASITGSFLLGPRVGEDDPAYVKACHRFADPYVSAFCSERPPGAGVRFGASAGSLPAYACRKLGIPGFDLEWDGNPDALPSHTDQTTMEILRTYQERHYQGLLATLKACADHP